MGFFDWRKNSIFANYLLFFITAFLFAENNSIIKISVRLLWLSER